MFTKNALIITHENQADTLSNNKDIYDINSGKKELAYTQIK